MTCEGDCNINLHRLYSDVVCDRDHCINFLVSHGVIKNVYKCPKCDSVLILNKNGKFRCDKRVYSGISKTFTRCRVQTSGLQGTFFSQSKLTFCQVVTLSYHFLWNRATQEEIALDVVELSVKTVADWFSFSREVIIDYVDRNSEAIGGPGKTVEIDEAKFGKRKYQRGRFVQGCWVLVGSSEKVGVALWCA